MTEMMCAHRGNINSERLWWTTYNGAVWRGDTEFSNGAKSASAPALIVFGGTLYCVHRGEGGSNDLWWSTFNPVTERWSNDTMFTNGNQSSEAPALAEFGGTLYCVHRGGSSSSLWWCTFDPTTQTWSGDKEFSQGNETAAGPALAVLGGTLYCVHRGSSDEYLWWCTFTGSDWTSDTQFEKDNASYRAPALLANNGTIYCVHRGKEGFFTTAGEQLWWCQWTGTNWTEDTEFKEGNKTADAPALALFNSSMYCVHRGLTYPGKGDDELYFTTFTGSNWAADTEFTSGNLSSDGVALALVDFP